MSPRTEHGCSLKLHPPPLTPFPSLPNASTLRVSAYANTGYADHCCTLATLQHGHEPHLDATALSTARSPNPAVRRIEIR